MGISREGSGLPIPRQEAQLSCSVGEMAQKQAPPRPIDVTQIMCHDGIPCVTSNTARTAARRTAAVLQDIGGNAAGLSVAEIVAMGRTPHHGLRTGTGLDHSRARAGTAACRPWCLRWPVRICTNLTSRNAPGCHQHRVTRMSPPLATSQVNAPHHPVTHAADPNDTNMQICTTASYRPAAGLPVRQKMSVQIR
jgi:hypothetical protein